MLIRSAVALFVIIGGIIIGLVHNVPTELSPEDRSYIEKLLVATGKQRLKPNAALGRPLAEQAAIIAEVQSAVLAMAPTQQPIAFDHEREPKDLFESRFGECYDRSRTIEKALAYIGLQTRHLAVYSTAESGSALASFLTPQNPSHALTEVLTDKGWMLVDSNDPWIGLTKALDVISAQELQIDAQIRQASWHSLSRHDINSIFKSDFTYLIGLYSRHGRFYPPYNFIPDVNFWQLVYNLIGAQDERS